MASRSNEQAKATTVLNTFTSKSYIIQKVQVNGVEEVHKELDPNMPLNSERDEASKRLKNEHDTYSHLKGSCTNRIVNMRRKHEKHNDQQVCRLEMEFVGPTLEERLNDKRQPALEDSEKKKIILEIAEGLQYIHSKKVVHADINTSNILLKGNKYDVKIKGFGASRIKTNNNTEDSDMYDLGMLIKEMYQGETKMMPPIIKKCYDLCQRGSACRPANVINELNDQKNIKLTGRRPDPPKAIQRQSRLVRTLDITVGLSQKHTALKFLNLASLAVHHQVWHPEIMQMITEHSSLSRLVLSKVRDDLQPILWEKLLGFHNLRDLTVLATTMGENEIDMFWQL
ncbi:hypothetical protein BGZ65_007872 [Modicella reniformis]|uniref:Protein kinase domain-containing protein n=1 Tax=Modicella reniformis TaxID=1440133 RepID=A0A9P6MAW8_9FUNG|nr:hypothetical protein BGZ65_007872 [Modicella reniformis]